MENVRKHRDIKLVTTESRRDYLLSGPSYHTKTFYIYKDIAEDVETRSDTSNCQKEKIKKVIRLMKDELGNIMTEFVGLKAKNYSYLIDDGSEDKRAKDTKIVS